MTRLPDGSTLFLRLAWVLATLLALGLFVPGVFLQAQKLSHGVLGIWMAPETIQGRLLTVAPGLGADQAGLRTGDLLLTRVEYYDPQAARWVNDITYRDAAGAIQQKTVALAAPARLPLGLPPGLFAWISVLADVLFFLGFLLVGTLVIWRIGGEGSRDSQRFALAAAVALLVTAVRIPPEVYLQTARLSIGHWLDPLLRISGYALFPLFLSLFPNGRWVPRWIWVYPIIGLIFSVTLFTGAWQPGPGTLAATLFDVLIVGVGVLAQGYRYVSAASSTERQQTRWAVFGIGAAFVFYYIFQVLDSSRAILALFPTFKTNAALSYLYIVFWPKYSLVLLLIPLTLVVSILRYRLWDIDLIIRRTLSYTVVTSLLAGLYFTLVIALQEALRLLTGQTSTLAIILSTLVITLMFVPLRQAVQSFIDRRFYRSRYSAAHTLEQFSVAVRSEMDLDRLLNELGEVVEDTLHPQSISIWIHPGHRPNLKD